MTNKIEERFRAIQRAARDARDAARARGPVEAVRECVRQRFPVDMRDAEATLAELDAALARVAELEAIERRAQEVLAAGQVTPDGQAHAHAAGYILGYGPDDLDKLVG